jgi:electron transfer flavoprotein beta subunit
MDIGVLVKAALDVNLVKGDDKGRLLVDAMPLVISEYDRNAVAEAVRLRDEVGGKVIIFSVLTWGPVDKKRGDFENVIREALALGGDEAHAVVDSEVIPFDHNITAAVLGGVIEKLGGVDLILTGEGSVDITSSQIPTRLGEKLGYNVVTYARKIEYIDGRLRVTRDLEDILEVVETPLPAVVSVTGEINRPRLPTLLQIRRSFAKPLNIYSLSDIGVDIPDTRYSYRDITIVSIARKNIIIEGESMEDIAVKLIDKLVEEGVVKV